MHDAEYRPLQAGDLVLVPCRIKETYQHEEYCYVTLDSVFSLPDGKVATFSTDAGLTLRANAGDANDLTDIQPQPQPEPQPDPSAPFAAAPEPSPEPDPSAPFAAAPEPSPEPAPAADSEQEPKEAA